MEVVKVKTTRDISLFNKIWFKGTIFYIAKVPSSVEQTLYKAREVSDVFSEKGKLLGSIEGHWFDCGNKTLFKEIKE